MVEFLLASSMQPSGHDHVSSLQVFRLPLPLIFDGISVTIPCHLTMRRSFHVPRSLGGIFAVLLAVFNLHAQTTNTIVRVMSANLNGNTQSYQPFAFRIFQGLKPDIVAIQEFNYSNNTPSDFRAMVDTAFGTNFVYFRENYTANGPIPNAVISRYPIVASGSWADTVQSQPNRGYAWAQIHLPGTNDLYLVSVHFLTSSATDREQSKRPISNH